MDEATLLNRPSLHDEIVGSLRRMIISGDLSSGTWIAEPALCRSLGVSRTPLREALKVLAFDQWVELVPNRGAVVTSITPDEAAALFELLEGLEQFVGELVAERASDADIAAISALHDALAAHFANGEVEAYFAVNQKIHLRLVEAARNPALAATHENLSRKVLRARAMANLLTGRQEASFSEHVEILDALERRDGATLGRLLRAHIRGNGEAVREALTKRTSSSALATPPRRGRSEGVRAQR